MWPWMKVKVNIINTWYIFMPEAVTVPSWMIITFIVSEELLAKDRHIWACTHTHTHATPHHIILHHTTPLPSSCKVGTYLFSVKFWWFLTMGFFFLFLNSHRHSALKSHPSRSSLVWLTSPMTTAASANTSSVWPPTLSPSTCCKQRTRAPWCHGFRPSRPTTTPTMTSVTVDICNLHLLVSVHGSDDVNVVSAHTGLDIW